MRLNLISISVKRTNMKINLQVTLEMPKGKEGETFSAEDTLNYIFLLAESHSSDYIKYLENCLIQTGINDYQLESHYRNMIEKHEKILDEIDKIKETIKFISREE